MVKELDFPANQLLALFNKVIRRLSTYFDGICKEAIRSKLETEISKKNDNEVHSPEKMQPVTVSLEVMVDQISLHSSYFFFRLLRLRP